MRRAEIRIHGVTAGWLTLNGKRKRIMRQDFVKSFTTLGLDLKQQENIFRKMKSAKGKWTEFIDVGFISNDYKKAFKEIISERFQRIDR